MNCQKAYVALAYYSDYECSNHNIIGVFLSPSEADEAKRKYEAKIMEIKAEPNPLTPEEQNELDNVSKDKFYLFCQWQERKLSIADFKSTKVEEYIFGEIKLNF